MLKTTKDVSEVFPEVFISIKVIRANTGGYYRVQILIIILAFFNIILIVIQLSKKLDNIYLSLIVFLMTASILIYILTKREKLKRELKNDIMAHGYAIKPEYVESKIGHISHSLSDTYVSVTYKFRPEKSKSKAYIIDTYSIPMHPDEIDQFELYLKNTTEVDIIFLRKTKYALRVNYEHNSLGKYASLGVS